MRSSAHATGKHLVSLDLPRPLLPQSSVRGIVSCFILLMSVFTSHVRVQGCRSLLPRYGKPMGHGGKNGKWPLPLRPTKSRGKPLYILHTNIGEMNEHQK